MAGAQPRIRARAAVARISDRLPRIALPPVLGGRQRSDARARRARRATAEAQGHPAAARMGRGDGARDSHGNLPARAEGQVVLVLRGDSAQALSEHDHLCAARAAGARIRAIRTSSRCTTRTAKRRSPDIDGPEHRTIRSSVRSVSADLTFVGFDALARRRCAAIRRSMRPPTRATRSRPTEARLVLRAAGSASASRVSGSTSSRRLPQCAATLSGTISPGPTWT